MTSLLVAVCSLVVAAEPWDTRAPDAVRFAVFNIFELDRTKLDERNAAGHGVHPQLTKAAEIIQRVRPDVLLVNEIDFDETQVNAVHFLKRYLRVSQNGQTPIDFGHIYFAPVNTGYPTGKDLNNDGKTDGPDDAFGYGKYPGQYGMALYSRFPMQVDNARTFQKLLWKDMPGNLLPDGTNGKPMWYSGDEAAIFRLSSKSHWDVPIELPGGVVHVLASHPTPPVFDGPEDRNGRRNFDEIRLWRDYLSGGSAAAYIKDDAGKSGGLDADAAFVIMGDLNADPVRAEFVYGSAAAALVTTHPRTHDVKPTSPGAGFAEPNRRGWDNAPAGWMASRTSGFGRIDYAMPSLNLAVRGHGVFWPAPTDPLAPLVNDPNPSSDHRLVWVDVVVPSR